MEFVGKVHQVVKGKRGHLLHTTTSMGDCGCRIEGNGTLQYPLTVKYCPKHLAAADLLDALEEARAQIVYLRENLTSKALNFTAPTTDKALDKADDAMHKAESN